MAELLRLSRPLLLPSTRMAPSVASHATPTTARLLGRSFGTTSNRAMLKPKAKGSDGNKERDKEEWTYSMLTPGTTIPPPLSRWPRQPRKVLHLVWLLLKNKVLNKMGMVGLQLQSMKETGKWTPQLKPGRKTALPAAREYHVQMLSAMARNDKETLRQVCSTAIYHDLCSAIDRRPGNSRTEWELIRYVKPWRYPRLTDFRVSLQPKSDDPRQGMRLIRQAVVTINSVQRVARFETKMVGPPGRAKPSEVPVPNSDRTRTLLEHIVIQSSINDKTYECSPWQIWGFTSEQSYEDIVRDAAL
ncbi:hypothetical protein F4780DRAFT_779334 [Xylariomycetidae sp. FL0641]|nr:hypothetical protein F4780DRAFT_779334 [Xylariomycetidae sp. FL0641]